MGSETTNYISFKVARNMRTWRTNAPERRLKLSMKTGEWMSERMIKRVSKWVKVGEMKQRRWKKKKDFQHKQFVYVSSKWQLTLVDMPKTFATMKQHLIGLEHNERGEKKAIILGIFSFVSCHLWIIFLHLKRRGRLKKQVELFVH